MFANWELDGVRVFGMLGSWSFGCFTVRGVSRWHDGNIGGSLNNSNRVLLTAFLKAIIRSL